MDVTGAHTGDWSVSLAGTPAQTGTPTLAAVLVAVDDHPHGLAVRAVLERVPLLPTADTAHRADGLIIGRDGSFAAGPTFGRAPGARHADELPAATHVGGQQRRQAALARAVALDAEADALAVEAATRRAAADRLVAEATMVSRTAAGFPALKKLETAESDRAMAARARNTAREEVAAASTQAADTEQQAAQARRAWVDRTRDRGLPTTVDLLKALQQTAKAAAEALTRASNQLTQRLLPRASRLDTPRQPTADRSTVAALPADLTELVTAARRAHDAAASARVEYETLEHIAGPAAQEAVRQAGEAQQTVQGLEGQEPDAGQAATDAAAAVAGLEAQVGAAQEKVEAARPAADAGRAALVRVMRVAGVADALAGQRPPASMELGEGNVEKGWWESDPLAAVGDALTGRRSAAKRTLRERYDTVRPALTGTWTLDPADSVGELDTFLLTHDDVSYSPPAAARRAEQLKDRAKAALDAAEEGALRDFVIGRLPAAIGVAWTRMHDWLHTVNRKMRSAAASSGVGVQVRLQLSGDLSPSARTAYELSCRVANADRTTGQKQDLGSALTQLIDAADGETMTERIADAVDVRSWVTIHYEIDRGAGKTERWGSKTALSGGERRLVVLAPMLAAVAAGYDNIGEQGLRLAALDEVPAEVDERGREGLARYLAELDLDLVATSYLWDGAPGAWDGIDAHDLEAGSDGTVVAFPMLVRGLLDLPGDTLRHHGAAYTGAGAGERP